MSLSILVIMVVVGVSAVGLAVHMSGGGRKASLAGEEAARARYGEDFPDDTVERVFLAAGGEGAILQLKDGAVGIVHNFGDRFVTRRFADAMAVETRDDGAGGLTLVLREFAWPRVHFRFDDETSLRRARAAIGKAGGELEGTA